MKQLAEFLTEDEAPTNSTAGVAMPDSKPLFTKSKFAGVDCIDVDDNTYNKCRFGKRPFSRWAGVIEDEGLRSYVQTQFNRTSNLMIKNSVSGAMTYIKRS